MRRLRTERRGAVVAVAVVASLAVAVQVAILGSALLAARSNPALLTSAPTQAYAPPLSLVAATAETPEPATQSPATQTTTVDRSVDLDGWAAELGPAVGIPPTALAAYGRAQLAVASSDPGCRLSWPTLAGIGWIESHHGQVGGAVLQADGRSVPPIVGVALSGGTDIAVIHDSDDGQLDGDAVYDRAVGPLQFLPRTWAVWASDGDGDGVLDPYDIDDAALAAARYLCASGANLTGGVAWHAAVFSYNHSDSYVANVLAAANTYANASIRAD